VAKRNIGWVGAFVLAASITASAQESVRSSQSGLTALIARANAQSQTFRRLSNDVNASDGIVYVEPGRCGHGVTACLTNVTIAGGTRILWVRVDTRKHETDLIASIGHELRHAIEVLGNPRITTNAAMHLFYVREGVVRGSGAFETPAAVEAGKAVRAEVWKIGK
jgi:plastocyanin